MHFQFPTSVASFRFFIASAIRRGDWHSACFWAEHVALECGDEFNRVDFN